LFSMGLFSSLNKKEQLWIMNVLEVGA
jgi:hypothetical protein